VKRDNVGPLSQASAWETGGGKREGAPFQNLGEIFLAQLSWKL